MTAEYAENLEVAAAARRKQKAVAAIGLFVFAITLTFLATDWIMSLDETFSSSMFPVIVFDNSAVRGLFDRMITLLYLKKKGRSAICPSVPGDRADPLSAACFWHLRWRGRISISRSIC